MNVLITSAGRALPVLRTFIPAAAARGGSVIAADRDGAGEPAATIATTRTLSPEAPDYGDRLCEIVDDAGIGAVVPLADTDLADLARLASPMRERGCTIAVGSADFVELASDKAATMGWCRRHDVRVPETWSAAELDPDDVGHLPGELFVRPRRGTGSRDARPMTRGELAALLRSPGHDELIVQERIRCAEVTIDALVDVDGRVISVVPRLRLATEAGRSTRSTTIVGAEVVTWAVEVVGQLADAGARGLLCLQVFVGRGAPTLVEINARAAAGLPLSVAAGADQPAWLLASLAGERVTTAIGCHRPNVSMVTYPEAVFAVG